MNKETQEYLQYKLADAFDLQGRIEEIDKFLKDSQNTYAVHISQTDSFGNRKSSIVIRDAAFNEINKAIIACLEELKSKLQKEYEAL